MTHGSPAPVPRDPAPGAPGQARRIVIATRNTGKLAELARILGAAGLDAALATLADFPGAPEVAETGRTFAGNALLKARSAAACTGLPAVADDSGLCVDALNGMPGVLSARWAGGHGDDRANLELVLAQISGVPAAGRGAQFVCAAALVLPDGTERVCHGSLRGHLTRAPRGTNGFGYDPVFVPGPEEFAGVPPDVAAAATPDLTTAEMAPAAKDAISHRGRALRALAPVIAELLS